MTGEIMEFVTTVAEWSIAFLELAGIGIIMIFVIYATAYNLYLLATRGAEDKMFQSYRLQLARGILLGLEFLVAADIIKTVAVDFTFSSVGVLAVIVLIRTFLSFAIEIEMTGNLPWKRPTSL